MDIPPKDKDFAFIIPGDLRTYIYSNERDYIVVNKKDVLHHLFPLTPPQIILCAMFLQHGKMKPSCVRSSKGSHRNSH